MKESHASALVEQAITGKRTTDCPKSKILALEVDFVKHRFLKSFLVNTNGNVMNNTNNNDLRVHPSVYEAAVGGEQRKYCIPVLPNLFYAFLPWLILELFIPPLLHNFS